MTPDKTRGFRVGSWRRRGRRGGGGRGRWTGAVDGGGGRATGRTKKPGNSIKPTKTPHTPIHRNRNKRTAHCEPRRHARDVTASSHVEPPAIPNCARARARPTKRPGHEKRGATRRRSRANRHARTAPMTEDETRASRRRPKSYLWIPGNPEPQSPQTTPDRAHQGGGSKARLDPTERPTERPTHRPRGDTSCRFAVSAAARARRRS